MSLKLFDHVFTALLICTLFNSCAQESRKVATETIEVDYLDNNYPDTTPRLYAPGIINKEGRFQQNLTMTSDGSEHLITITDGELWAYQTILSIKKDQGQLTIDTPNFVTNFQFKDIHFIGEPMISPDDQKLFFVADYPPDLWYCEKSDEGDWVNAKALHLSTEKADWYMSVSKKNNLFFSNGNMYKSAIDGNQFGLSSPMLPDLIDGDILDPFVSPNEDFIIFGQHVDETTGQTDLFLTYKTEDGWSKPQRLRNEINTDHYEIAPSISPDGKFLFFSRRDSWQNATYSNVYWVSMDVILAMMPD